MSSGAPLTLAGLAGRLNATLERAAALTGGETASFAIAVSGGSDSLALMLAAATVARGSGRTCHVISVDHGLRAEAKSEIAHVARLAARLRLPHHIETWENPPADVGQAGARDARYRLLAQACRRTGARLLLTGHTEDDQAETVLMRAAHGSTIVGLAAMRWAAPMPVWPEGEGIVLLRPFLHLSRRSLRNLLTELRVRWIDDPSNDNDRFERVRIRELISAQPALREHALGLLRPARRMRERQDAELSALLTRADLYHGGIIGLPASAFSRTSQSARIRALRLLVSIAAGNDRPARREGLEPLIERVRQGSCPAATLNGAMVWRDGAQVFIARDPGTISPAVTAAPDAGETLWDARYAFANTGSAPVRIGRVEPARPLREDLRALLRELPAPARASQPGIFDAEGQVIALPELHTEPGLTVRNLMAARLDFERKLLALHTGV